MYGSASPALASGPPVFLRGDVDGDGLVIATMDAARLLRWGFAGGADLPCLDAADVDDSGAVSPVLDSLALLDWAFTDGDAPPDPGPFDCGSDPAGDLGCLAPADPCPGVVPKEGDAGYLLAISDVSDVPPVVGAAVEVDVTLTNDGEAIQSWQFSVCHDDLVAIAADGVALGSDLVDSVFGFSTLAVERDAWTAAAFLEFGDVSLAAGGEYELYSATYTLLGGAGLASITFCELGDPEIVSALGTDADDVIFPTLEAGSILIPGFIRGDVNGDGLVIPAMDAAQLLRWGFAIGTAPPCLDAADVDDSGLLNVLQDSLALLNWALEDGAEPPAPGPFDCGLDPDGELGCLAPADPCPGAFPKEGDADYVLSIPDVSDVTSADGAAVEVEVTLANPGGDIQGWQFSVCHDDLVSIAPDGVALGIDVADSEFAFSDISVDATSWTAAAFLSLVGDDFLAAGGRYELYTAAYTLGGVPGLAPITFCEVGDPVIVSALGTPEDDVIFPTLEAGSILIPGFIRGDANGVLGFELLLDPLFALTWAFLEGPDPPCLDAVDADDDGDVIVLEDALYSLYAVFVPGSPPIPAPAPGCGVDPTADTLGCADPSCP